MGISRIAEIVMGGDQRGHVGDRKPLPVGGGGGGGGEGFERLWGFSVVAAAVEAVLVLASQKQC